MIITQCCSRCSPKNCPFVNTHKRCIYIRKNIFPKAVLVEYIFTQIYQSRRNRIVLALAFMFMFVIRKWCCCCIYASVLGVGVLRVFALLHKYVSGHPSTHQVSTSVIPQFLSLHCEFCVALKRIIWRYDFTRREDLFSSACRFLMVFSFQSIAQE